MVELEREKTYLLKRLPSNLVECRYEVIRDAYIPVSSPHPSLRLRCRGDRCEMTKKVRLNDGDASRHTEHTIRLTVEESTAFDGLTAKRSIKYRYYCVIDGYPAEVDLYQEDLTGLSMVDFEFESDAVMSMFTMPDICLADVTQEEAFAGGMLAGKTYSGVSGVLDAYTYKPLFLEKKR
jgi:CYTH domain-containing protein